MSQLYRDHAGCELLRSSRELQAKLREFAREIEHNLDNEHNHLLYQCLTADFFTAHVHPAVTAYIHTGETTSYADLLLWAAVIGNEGLMRLFWARAPSNQVALALLCAYTMRRKARLVSWGRNAAKQAAVEREQWAIGVFEQVERDETARTILGQVLPTGPGASLTLLGLATLLEMKAFLSHRHCQAMLDGWWRVDRPCNPRCSLPEDTSYPLLLCQALVPLPSFNPFVLSVVGRGTTKETKEHDGHNAALALVSINAWSAAMSLAIKLRRMSMMEPISPRGSPTGRRGGNGPPAPQEGAAQEARRRWATSKSVVLGSASRLGLVGLFTRGAGMDGVRLLGGESKQLLRHELRDAQQQMREAERTSRARAEAGADDGSQQAVGVGDPCCTRLTGVRLRLAFYSVPMTKFVLRFASYCCLIGLYVIVQGQMYNIDELREMQSQDSACGLPPAAEFAAVGSDSSYSVGIGDGIGVSGGGGSGGGGHVRGLDAEGVGGCIDGGAARLSAALEITAAEVLLVIWSIGLLCDDLRQDARLYAMGSKLETPFGKTLRLSSRSVVLAFAMRGASANVLGGLSSGLVLPAAAVVPLYIAYSWHICINIVFVVFRMTQYRSVATHHGILIISLEAMVVDIISWLEIFILCTAGICLAFKGLAHSTGTLHSHNSLNSLTHESLVEWLQEDWYKPSSDLMRPLWAVFGEFGELGGPEGLEKSLPWASPLLWMYTLVSSIVLTNLLVAMFADTYARVLASSEVEHRYQKAVRIFQHQHAMHTVPPPFNLPLLAASALRRLAARLGTWCCAHGAAHTGGGDSGGGGGITGFFWRGQRSSAAAGGARKASVCLSKEELSRMAGRDGALRSFGVGARIVHRQRGAGVVLEIMPDGRTRILFDSGEEHRYKPASMRKLRAEGTALVLIVAEKVCADAYLAETAAAAAGSTDTRLQASQEAVGRLGASVALQLEMLRDGHRDGQAREQRLDAKLGALLETVEALHGRRGGGPGGAGGGGGGGAGGGEVSEGRAAAVQAGVVSAARRRFSASPSVAVTLPPRSAASDAAVPAEDPPGTEGPSREAEGRRGIDQ